MLFDHLFANDDPFEELPDWIVCPCCGCGAYRVYNAYVCDECGWGQGFEDVEDAKELFDI